MDSLFNPVKIVHVAQVVSFANDWHHSIDLLTIDGNSELRTFEECAYKSTKHCQTTLFPGAVHDAVA